MKKFFIQIIILFLSAVAAWSSLNYLENIYRLIGIFSSGMFFGILLMLIVLNVKTDKLNLYKRELEKESISSTESDAKVKILESKIAVLEKTLEKFLTK